jgi:hypothetical protein
MVHPVKVGTDQKGGGNELHEPTAEEDETFLAEGRP